jgi:hypothetical protein
MSTDYAGLSKLISACSKAKVAKLKCGEVEVEFLDGTMDFKQWPSIGHRTAEVHGEGENRVEFDKQDESQMLLEDPLEYEKMQLEE